MSENSETPSGGKARTVLLGIVAFLFLFVVALYGAAFWFLRNPAFGGAEETARAAAADAARLKRDVAYLASIMPSRSIHNPAALALAADHIEAQFSETGCGVTRHEFEYRDRRFYNVICSFGPSDAKRVILGAHYDVFQSGPGGDLRNAMPGADDNASGTAALLEIARMIAREKPVLEHRVDLVAFTLEEYVEPDAEGGVLNIGSGRYAAVLKAEGAEIALMVSVEMIGFFDDAPGSQAFPAPLTPLLTLFYPDKADFIGVIGRAFDRALVKRVRRLMQVQDIVPVHSINAPGFVPGIDRSDHKAFWAHGFPAVLVTDTADLRNPNYHRAADTPATLDYRLMGGVVEGLYSVAVNF